MKLLLFIIAVAGGVVAASAQEIEQSQLPAPVVKALGDVKGPDLVGKIERQVKDGKTIYEVQFARRGVNPRVWIAEDGTVIRDTRRVEVAIPPIGEGVPDYVAPLNRTRTLQLTDVPVPVQKAIREHAAGRDVADIDRETWKGHVVYEVEFAQTGRNALIHIADDGTIVRAERVGTGVLGVHLGTQLEDTPAAVQDTIKRVGGNRPIADIDREHRNGQTVYEVEFKEPGRNIELHIAENGRILQDSRKLEAVGSAGRQPQTGVGAARDVQLDDLPANIRSRIQDTTGDAQPKRIRQTTENGLAVYEVELESNGKTTRFRVTSDGTVLKDR